MNFNLKQIPKLTFIKKKILVAECDLFLKSKPRRFKKGTQKNKKMSATKIDYI